MGDRDFKEHSMRKVVIAIIALLFFGSIMAFAGPPDPLIPEKPDPRPLVLG